MGTTQKDLAHGIPQFRGNIGGYENWSYRVRLFLEAAGVSEVLTEDVPEQAAERTKFVEKDRKGKALLVSCLADDCLEVVREKTTTKLMWESLEVTYAKKSVASQTLIRKQLARLRMKNGIDMRSHFLEFDGLVRKLKTAGATLVEADLVSQLFLTLPDTYDPLVTALENVAEKELTLDFVKQRLLAEESKRTDRQEEFEEVKPAAFTGHGHKQKKQQKFNGKCHGCGRRGHYKKDCRLQSKSEANSVVKNAVSFMADVDPCRRKRAGRIVFKLDSGCSDHLVSESSVFANLRKLDDPVEIKVAKEGQAMIAKTIGEINAVSNRGVPFNVKNVLLVPDLRENLMSVKKMTKAGIDVLFSGDTAVLKKNGSVLATGYLKGNLFEIELFLQDRCANMCDVDTGKLWHRRLGHISQQGLETMARNGELKGMRKAPKIGICEACIQGKQCREPFNGTRIRATRPLERIHSDVCGPIDPAAWDGSRYFVSFIDDYSHFGMIYPIKRKSEVFEKFKEYEAAVTAMIGKPISRMTVDQGREYFSTDQKNYYKQKGIQVEPTVAYTPQQNGVAERFNRTLVERIRSVLIDSLVPKNLWSEAALACVYLLNRSPTSALPSGVSPAELWFNSKPNLDKLRIFGCKSFAWIPAQNRKKLDPKSREMVMIGYAPNGYRLWDKKSRKIIIARDVKFDENSFPYADIENMKPEIDVPLLVRFPFDQEGEGEVAVHDNHEQVDARESEPEEEFSDALPLQTERPLQESRHSGRERRLPGKLLDYLTGYRATSASLLLPDAPETFAEINGRPDRKVWLKAVEDELRSMDENHVWYFTSCPAGVKPLKSKWIFRVKEDVNGQPVRYKARLVVKGFLQKQGLDYDEIFAPVAKLTTIRIILSAGIHQGFHFHQMDVKTAFLHGELKETIFMEIPDGVDAPPNTVCRLVKSLYGLKQSPRCWNEKFNQKLLEQGFVV